MQEDVQISEGAMRAQAFMVGGGGDSCMRWREAFFYGAPMRNGIEILLKRQRALSTVDVAVSFLICFYKPTTQPYHTVMNNSPSNLMEVAAVLPR